MRFTSWLRPLRSTWTWKASAARRQRRRPACARPQVLALEERVVLSPYVVNTTADDGRPGSLRDAINQVNTPGGPTEIDFDIPTSDSRYHAPTASVGITSVSVSSNLATLATSGPVPFAVGQMVTVAGLSNSFLDGDYRITAVSATSFSYAFVHGDLTPTADSGTVSDPSWFTIALSSTLPDIGNPVIINGYSQPGASPNTLAVGDNAVIKINLDGCQVVLFHSYGLSLQGGDSTVQGLALVDFGHGGPSIDVGGHNDLVADNDLIAGNFLGIDPSGAPGPSPASTYYNQTGVLVEGGNNTIGGASPAARNVLSVNGLEGVSLAGPGNCVEGNYIGTDPTGTQRLGNTYGIWVMGSNNTVGGLAPGQANVIAGNDSSGILFRDSVAASGHDGGTGNVVEGNFIGTNEAGATNLGNRVAGLFLVAPFGTGYNPGYAISGNTIAYNTIASSSLPGLLIQGPNVTANTIVGNTISGGNDWGIYIMNQSSGNVIQDNAIVGNRLGGVFLDGSTSNNTVGGLAAGTGNTIASNPGDGVCLGQANPAGTGNAILGNAIQQNGGAGVRIAVGGDLTIAGCTLSGNAGGGVANAGTLSVSGCVVTGNGTASGGGNAGGTVGVGGGIYNTGTLTVSGSAVAGNTATVAGGGIYNTGTLTIQSASAVYGNQAPGGANVENVGSLDIEHSAVRSVEDQNGGATIRNSSPSDSATALTAAVDGSGRVTFTATVLAAQPGGATPTGTVRLYDSGNNVLGTVSLGSDASAIVAGNGPFHAVYSGDANLGSSTSAPLIQPLDPLQVNSLQAVEGNPLPLVAVPRLDPVPNNGLTQFRDALDTVYFDGTQSRGGAADDPLHYLWDFGDGTTSTDPSPSHIYQDAPAGGYTVTLTVTDESGLPATTSTLHVNMIDVPPSVSIQGGSGSGPFTVFEEDSLDGLQAYVFDYSPVIAAAGFTYQWSVTKDGQSYTLSADVLTSAPTFSFTPDDAGTYVATVTVRDKNHGAGEGEVEVDVQDVPAAAYLLNSSSPAAAMAGDLDPSFGGGAPVITDVSPGSTASSLGVAVYPSSDPADAGKVLNVGTTDAAGGNLALAQYNADGTPDASFGSNGIVTNFPGTVNAFALEADGKLLVAGQSSNNNGDFALARYLTRDTVINGVTYHTGDLDPTFGKGGVVTTDFAGGQDNAVALTVDHQGRIILVGNTVLAHPDSWSDYYAAEVENLQDIAVARYNPDGTPDTNFGSFGTEVETANSGWGGFGVVMTNTGSGGTGNSVTTDFDSNDDPANHFSDTAWSVAVDGQNRILVLAGSGRFPGTGVLYPFLLRYNSTNGKLDRSFNGTGWIPDLDGDQIPSGLTVDGSNRVVVGFCNTGNAGLVSELAGHMDVMRFAEDGSADPAFAGTGKASVVLYSDATGISINLHNSMAIDPSGGIVVGVDRGGSTSGPAVILARFTPGGALDSAFGNAGVSGTYFVLPPGDYLSGIALQADGKIVLGGGAWRENTDLGFVVARYLAQSESVPQGTQLTLNSAVYDVGAVDTTSLTYAWSVIGPAGYSLPSGTATGNANFTFTPDVPGTYIISLTVGNTDRADTTTTVTKTIVVAPLTTASLQQALPQNTGSANTVTIETSASVTQDAVIAAVNGLTVPQQPVTITLELNGGNYNDTTVSPPANVTLIINGASGTNTFVGHSPAFVVTGGTVIITNVTFTTDTDAPTIWVQGGSLTLRNDIIQESTGANDAAISVTGGTLDLGTTSNPGGNTLIVTGAGTFLSNTTGSPVAAVGNTTLTTTSAILLVGQSPALTATVNGTPFTGSTTYTTPSGATVTATLSTPATSASPVGTYPILLTLSRSGAGNAPISLTAGTLYVVSLGPDPSSTTGAQAVTFWDNKGNARLITAADLASLDALNLVTQGGSAFDPHSVAQLDAWLSVSPNATAAYRLAVQLAVMDLNVLAGDVHATDLVYAGGLLPYATADNIAGLTSGGFIDVQALMQAANAALALVQPGAPSGDPNAAYEQALAAVLQAANCNTDFVTQELAWSLLALYPTLAPAA